MKYDEVDRLKKTYPFLWARAKSLLLSFDLVTDDIDLETAKLLLWFIELRKASAH